MNSLIKSRSGSLADLVDSDWSSLIDDFYKNSSRASFNKRIPNVKVLENEESYNLIAEMPGVEKEDINIEYENNTLKISTESAKEEKEEKDRVIYNDFSKISYERSFKIKDVDIEKSTAELKNGLLNICLPKNEQIKIKKIKIK